MRSEICGGYNWSFFEAFFPALKSMVLRNIEKARKIYQAEQNLQDGCLCLFVFFFAIFLMVQTTSSVFPCVFKHVFGKHGNPPCCAFKFPLRALHRQTRSTGFPSWWQVKEKCVNEESTSDWSRPIPADTLVTRSVDCFPEGTILGQPILCDLFGMLK